MKLYNCKPNTKVKLLDTNPIVPIASIYPDENEILTFKKIDGMYSICKDANNKTIYLAAWTEVEQL